MSHNVFRNSIFDEVIDIVDQCYDLDKYINLKEYNKIIFEISIRFVEKLESKENIKIKFNEEVENIIYDGKIIK